MNPSERPILAPSWDRKMVWGIIRGVLISVIISLLLLLICSLVLHLTSVREKITPFLTCGIALLSVLYGSYHTGKQLGYRGWLHGGAVGVIYILLLLLVGILAGNSFTLGLNLFSKLFLGFVFGAAGGMWGVNT